MNKNTGFVLLLFFVLLSSSVFFDLHAQRGSSGGFGSSNVTVAEALRLRDDTPVILQGRIVRHIRSEYYLFSDETGNIRIEIPPRVWGDLRINQDDVIEITGIIDRHLFVRNKIYARNIRIIQNE
jgi:uncharacterized protein (TIGR00156 family)